MVIDLLYTTPLKNRLFRCKENRTLRRSISRHLARSKSIQPFRRRDPFPPSRHRRSAFSSWCLRGYCVALVSSCTNVRASSVQIPPSRIHPTVADHPPRCPSLSPAGSHCVRWCAPGGASKRSRSRRTPSTTGRDDHLQSWVQCVRVCSGPESCCERPAWLGVRAKLGQCYPRSLLRRHCHRPRRAPLGNGTRNSPSPTGIIGFSGPLLCVILGRRDAHLLGGVSRNLLRLPCA